MNEDLVRVEPPDALRPARAASAELLALPRLIVDAGPVAVGGSWSSSPRGSPTGARGRRTDGPWGSSGLVRGHGQGLALEAVSPLHVAEASSRRARRRCSRRPRPAGSSDRPGTLAGRRDRAVSVMLYSFARVSAVIGMRRQDYFRQESRGWLRLHEKGGKRHDVPAHHRAAEALDDYLEAAGLDEAKAALFQSVDPAGRRLTGRALSRRLVLAMIKRRAAAAGLPPSTCCHTFRATGITAYLSNGGTLEHAQQIAGHASPKTTKLYDRTADTITVDEIERIVI